MLNESSLQQTQSALAMMAEKYRQIGMRADLFDDGEIAEIAARVERNARRVVAQIGSNGLAEAADAELAATALTAFTDNLNRQVQLLAGRGQIQDAALIDHRLREAYGALTAVESERVGLSSPQHVAASVGGVAANAAAGEVR